MFFGDRSDEQNIFPGSTPSTPSFGAGSLMPRFLDEPPHEGRQTFGLFRLINSHRAKTSKEEQGRVLRVVEAAFV